MDTPPADAPAPARKRGGLGDVLFMRVTQVFALGVLVVVVLAVITTTSGAWPAIRAFGPGFLSGTTWDPAPDGKRFLVEQSAVNLASVGTSLAVVTEWFDELKRRAPARK